MAIIVPFKGVLYNRERVGNLDSVTAPPYDIISPEEQEQYYQLSPYNVIRLILGRQHPTDSETDNRYTRAAAFFRQWQAESVLKRDSRPCLYFYHQEFLDGTGRRIARDGFIALVRLEERDKGVIIPHEKTLDLPKEDRLKLMKACSANLSPVFSLYADPGVTNDLLLVLKFYKLQDSTGTIAVVTQKAVPKPGTRVRATGTVHQAFAIGKDQLTVIVEDSGE